MTFTLPGTERQFEAIELRHGPDGAAQPIVDGSTAMQVVAALGRPRAWIGRNIAVKATGIPGEVIEVLRPDEKGNYNLGSIAWLGDRPAKAAAATFVDADERPAQTRKRARA